ncbi:zinc finger protein 660-like [Cylas formicarius]|uniref:zinc finger protein 660-like n=1 Tax=Cylas formicarius TaxID=197179 RepID=UPI0029589D1A|nr:zinc finger protein 660-like [Cylas formicarius]
MCLKFFVLCAVINVFRSKQSGIYFIFQFYTVLMHEECRICLFVTPVPNRLHISTIVVEEKDVSQALQDCASIQVSDDDQLPKFVCPNCFERLQSFYEFRRLIITSDEKLKRMSLEFENVKLEEREEVSSTENEPENDANNDSYLDACPNNEPVKPRKGKRKKQTKLVHECVECQKTFKKADHLNVHISYKHAEKRFECEYCAKKFARTYDLAYHLRVHRGEKPYMCEICQKSFASSSYFYMHRRIHTGEKKCKCQFCDEAFINSDQLQIHVRQRHTGEKPYLCDICSSAFSSSSGLFRHKRDVHEKKELCPVCDKMYSGRVLKEHMRRHMEREAGIKRYVCEQCGKGFTCGTSRKRHLAVHSGEKPFKCDVCQKSFNQRSTLVTHSRVHSHVMPFPCEYCSKSFRYKHHLRNHVGKHHKEA